MAIFDALGISASGLMVNRKWMDAVSDNISNINTVNPYDQAPFQERFVVAQAVDYGSGTGGVRVAGVAFGSARGPHRLRARPPARRRGRATSATPTSTWATRWSS